MTLVPKDELGTVIAGISFLVQSIPDETFTLVEEGISQGLAVVAHSYWL